MFTLVGNNALAKFHENKLLKSLQKIIADASSIVTHFYFFMETTQELTEQEQITLKQLIGNNVDVLKSYQDTSCWVIPRLGTISPWSSKATDIVHNCGLTHVKRIERSIAYQINLTDGSFLTGSKIDQIKSILHDKMTEMVVTDFNVIQSLFASTNPRPLTVINLMDQGINALLEANQTLGLALSNDEIDYLLKQYQLLERNPTDVELMMFAQANSEHCRHKIFNASWTIDGQDKKHTLFQMIKNTYNKSPDGVLSAYKDNASVIKGFKANRFYPNSVTQAYDYHYQDMSILMKVETHNHPTAISPKAGAATGAGGEIRDEGATGRGAKPKAGLTGFTVSNLLIPNFLQPWEKNFGKPDHMASALDIMLEAPIGSACYNNEFGRPNLCGYFRTYEQHLVMQKKHEIMGFHKPIMLAGGFGNIDSEHVQKEEVPVGAYLVVLGGPAMQIGIGGGSASSMLSSDNQEFLDFASVQRDNPEMERRCQEVIDRCWQLGDRNPIRFIHDVGAGGLSNALPELVNDSGRGGMFHLRNVNNADMSMSPLALWCNESQERYVLAINPEELDNFRGICQRERCPFSVVGEAMEDKHLKVLDSYFNNFPVDMSLDVLLGKPPKIHCNVVSKKKKFDAVDTKHMRINEAGSLVLQLPCVASKHFLITIGDRSITGQVVRDQMVGPWQVPVADCSVTTTTFDSYTGEALAMGERIPIAVINAKAAGRIAIGEAITNIASTRIHQLSDIKLSANWMASTSHDNEAVDLFNTVQTVGLQLCPELGIAIPVGKDSMSMHTSWQDNGVKKSVVSPVSLVVSAFAPVLDVRKTVTPQLRSENDSKLFLIDLGRGKNRLAGSALAQVYNQIGNEAPDVDASIDLKRFFTVIQTCLENQWILAYHDRSDGGLFTTLVEMSFAARLGLDIYIDALVDEKASVISALFNEELGAVIQVSALHLEKVNRLIEESGLDECTYNIGSIRTDQMIHWWFRDDLLASEERSVYQQYWTKTSYHLQKLRDNPDCANQEFDTIIDANDRGLNASYSFDVLSSTVESTMFRKAKPKVAILREQGVNGHIEMAAAFDRAGFEAVDVHMSDIYTGLELTDFKGLIACGGFSYGDVLGAGRGWANSILLNERVKMVFSHFFSRMDTFTLGVCNGCQMLSHLRNLIPGSDHWPYFTRNCSEQFESRMVMVKVLENRSIFFTDMQGAVLPITVAHGEGLVDSRQEDYRVLQAKKKAVLQYVDSVGQVTEKYPYNPNGSVKGLTAVTSEDGRVTIMMPHPERVFRMVQNSWQSDYDQEDSPWMRMFYNARRWVG